MALVITIKAAFDPSDMKEVEKVVQDALEKLRGQGAARIEAAEITKQTIDEFIHESSGLTRAEVVITQPTTITLTLDM